MHVDEETAHIVVSVGLFGALLISFLLLSILRNVARLDVNRIIPNVG